ncbi:MAG: cytochrome c biogenesis protein CcsA [Chloroflexi bacterium]|nr:cytochrome c biogenesis protein CcsA [Chloroflexota bacterium]
MLFAKRSTPLTVLSALTAFLLIAALFMVLFYAPTERVMGAVQRIFYFHVGAAWAGALGFVVTAAAGTFYLASRKAHWDRIAAASVEVGVVLVTMTLTSGMVWARASWGTFFPMWDPKLKAVAMMWLVYMAYLLFRQAFADDERRARFSAVYGIIALASVLFAFVGVRMLDTAIHPVVIGGGAGVSSADTGLSPRMLHTLLFSVGAFTSLYATLVWIKARALALDAWLLRQQLTDLKPAPHS